MRILEFCILEAKQTQLSQYLKQQILQSLDHLSSFLLGSLQYVCLLSWGAQHWTQHSRCGLTHAESEP